MEYLVIINLISKECCELVDIKIEMFPALEGDSILISLGNEPNRIHILLDGGFGETYENHLKKRLKEIANINEKLSLVIVTHIDSDHIEGILDLFKENGLAENPQIITIDEVWHNSYRHLQLDQQDELTGLHWKERFILSDIITKANTKANTDSNEDKDISAEQGSSLAALLYNGNYKWNSQFDGKAVSSNNKKYIKLSSDISIHLLSPNNEKLDKLKGYWVNELRKAKYDFKLTDDKLFDDAYEFYLMNKTQQCEGDEDKEISSQDKGNDLIHFLDKKQSYDTSPANGSSISFVLKYKGRKMLFLGDSHPQLIRTELQSLFKNNDSSLFFDLIKVSHHGSHRNNSKALLEIMDSSIYLISTNGGKNKHPNKETIARIVCRESEEERNLVFNYFQANQPWDEQSNKQKYNFNVFYPHNGNSVTISYSDLGIKVE